MAGLEVVLGRGGEEGTSPGATGQSWPGGLCAALGPPHEARECLERSLLGRGGEGKSREGAPTELLGEEKTQKQLILLAELFL